MPLLKSNSDVFNGFLGWICDLLESGRAFLVSGCLKLLLAMTCSDVLDKKETDGRRIVNKVLRCLILHSEVVHLGVCMILVNLSSRGLASLTQLNGELISEFIRRSISASTAR
jgi:hypothetical protein